MKKRVELGHCIVLELMQCSKKAGCKPSAKRHPLARVGETSDAVQAVEYLLSSSWVTGQILQVDGGFSVIK